MKKLLTMAAIAAMSFGAQAVATWNFDIRHCETSSDGTIPQAFTVSLYDTNGGGYRQVYSQEINFSTLGYPEIKNYIKDGRFNIVNYVNSYPGGGTAMAFVGSDPLYLNSDDTYGIQAQLAVNGLDVYPSNLSDDDVAAYAANYVVEFQTDSGKYVLEDKSWALTSKSQLYTQGTLKDIVDGAVSAPEPTSGLLMLLGMAGLALKRKRA